MSHPARSIVSTMNKQLRMLVILGMLVSMLAPLMQPRAAQAAPSSASSPAAPDGTKVPILVKFKAGVSSAELADATAASGGQKVRDVGRLRTRIISVPANAAERVVAALSQRAEVERAEVAVKVGLGLQEGQELVMTAPLDAVPLEHADLSRRRACLAEFAKP